ncbi:hypothetical protein HDA32_003628 [Spinactinospora alkalitolerans]|uniref:DUF3060 domain-containing protein n=1 Tax=Spinactinospora alkalitolerans TaxID=687207 RepID=A0A852TX36_9ACTN|nr:DUF3060 domain-containing protein [Spinactinospora alkalitolerans]NYE48508.1 hypothetical protein [Spinactinospora alkalitolerans]
MRGRIAAVTGGVALLALFGAGCGVSVSEDGDVSVSNGGEEVSGSENGVVVSDGRTLTVAADGETATEDCAGLDVNVLASDTTLTFNGECGEVSIAGSNTEVHVGSAASISVTGADNVVYYASGEPSISNLGVNNTTEQGGSATP